MPNADAAPPLNDPTVTGPPTQIPAQAPAEVPSVASPSFFGVSVGDLDAAVSWYRRVLGLETVRSVESRDGRGRAVVMRRGELMVELVHFEGSLSPRADPEVQHPFQIEGLAKAGMFVADAGEWHTYLLGAHVDTDAQVVTDENLAVRTFVFRDLDDNRIQVFERCEQGC
ncbi:MAG: VOC family protein [Acidobacteriota bacterium]